jgi:oligopeptide transport system ATP-binding protein
MFEIRELRKHFRVGARHVLKAVDGVSFDIFEGETLGLVGESGCGKTTLGRVIKHLYPPTSGQVLFRGTDIADYDRAQLKKFTKEAQMIFQDPYSSLNPRMTVAEIIAEGMEIHGLHGKKDVKNKTYELLEMVGLNREHASRFPHEFSGGQRQRVGIARALAVAPEFLVCDEPISALDVSIQAQIVNLFKKIQKELKLTYLFIAHDLSMVKYISDRVAVMYLGKIVEIAPSSALYSDPIHPYTEYLLSAIPIPDPRVEAKRQNIELDGEVPSPLDLPRGCSFRARCKYARDDCKENPMVLAEQSPGHWASCILAKKGQLPAAR